MKRAAVKIFPKLLNFEQNNIAFTSLSRCWRHLTAIQKVLTGDESWVYGNDIETKAQSFQVLSNVKVLLAVFFDYKGAKQFVSIVEKPIMDLAPR